MKIIIYSKSSGEILRAMDIPLEAVSLQVTDSTIEGILEVPNLENLDKYYVDVLTSTLVDVPEQPSQNHRFDYETKTWIDPRTLADVKVGKNIYINTERARANQTSFTFQGKEVATDPLSRSDIDGVNGEVAITGALPATFPNAWKAIDNSYISIPDVATWKLFYQAMVSKGTENFLHAQDLKAQVQAATTINQVEGIIW